MTDTTFIVGTLLLLIDAAIITLLTPRLHDSLGLPVVGYWEAIMLIIVVRILQRRTKLKD